MIRFLALAALSVFGLVQAGCSAKAQGEQQTLVDRATLTMQEMMTQTVSSGPRDLLRNARAVMICPQIFKAGFFLGGEGGNCVLVARGGNGAWSYPAFYSIGSGSFGFQFGIEDNELFMLIMTEHGLNAILDSQIKLGANAGLAIATIGAGVQGSTTTAVGADIVAFSESRGLFGGIAIEGSVMSTKTDWDQAYYGQPFAARQLVKQMQGTNPGADPLRDILTRYGQGGQQPPPGYPPPQGGPGYAPAYPAGPPPQQQGYAPPPQPGYGAPAQQQYAPPQQYGAPPPPGGRGPIQQQSLSAPNSN
jgi:SH3 domain-containing YSC84-like protein 1